MKLLNTSNIVLKEFVGDQIPSYAILSHRWGDREVALHQLHSQSVKSWPGYLKILGLCRQARQDGYNWAWIDTCCIDKTNSNELSEAISSMFNWYQQASVCYVYLSDVEYSPNLDKFLNSFYLSAYFTRGWTLQELLAPANVVFFDKEWVNIGTRKHLSRHISSITKIPEHQLDENKIIRPCVAEIMSWAADRQTLLVEDEAYCLMGLFGVTMPILYGEGSQAFIRLQYEIIKKSNDESIFAWGLDDYSQEDTGLLATSARAFRGCGRITPAIFDADREPVSITTNGLHIEPLAWTPEAFKDMSRRYRLYFQGHGCGIVLNCAFWQETRTPIKVALVIKKEKFNWERHALLREDEERYIPAFKKMQRRAFDIPQTGPAHGPLLRAPVPYREMVDEVSWDFRTLAKGGFEATENFGHPYSPYRPRLDFRAFYNGTYGFGVLAGNFGDGREGLLVMTGQLKTNIEGIWSEEPQLLSESALAEGSLRPELIKAAIEDPLLVERFFEASRYEVRLPFDSTHSINIVWKRKEKGDASVSIVLWRYKYYKPPETVEDT